MTSEMWKGAVAGLLGGLAGAWAMNGFQRLAERAGNGREARGAAAGDAREGRGPQPAQAHTTAEDDATARLVEGVSQRMLGRPLDRETRLRAGKAAHFAFGGLSGAAYGLAADAWPAARRGQGIAFGTLVWAVADEGVVPAVGLSRGPRELPWSTLGYGFLSHVVFGLTTESVRNSVRRML